MQSKQLIAIAAAVALTAGTAALAQDAPRPPADPVSYEAIRNLTPPVTAGDITGRPYRVVGEVRAEVRKATVFSRAPSQNHVFRELWERAERLGADAVINANYGDARVTAMSWGSRRATGQAIKFLTDAEIAAQGAAEPVSENQAEPQQ